MINDLIKCRSPQLCEKLLDNQQAGGKHGSIKAHGNFSRTDGRGIKI